MNEKMREFIDSLCTQLNDAAKHYSATEIDSDTWNDVWMDNINDAELIIRAEIRARGIKLQ